MRLGGSWRAGSLTGGAPCTGASPSWTATPDAASVQACITSAVDGDTIHLSPGSATWTTTVDVPITKGLKIVGAGVGATIITHGVAGHMMTLGVQAGNSLLSVGNFTVNANDNTNIVFALYGVITGTTTPCLNCYRFHHITVNNINSNVFNAIGDNAKGSEISGLFDHITCKKTLASGTPHCIRIDATSAVTDPTSDTAFTWPLNMGTSHMTHVEDSVIDYSGAGGADGGVDNFNGSQIVYRKNTILGTELCGWHGSDSGRRGIHSFECYRNTLNGLNVWPSGGNMRSGVGMTFENTLTNYTDAFNFSIYRIPPGNGQVWSVCDGTQAKDGNTGTGSPRPLGYPFIDQTGWFFGAGADPAFTLTPSYYWLNRLNSTITDPSAGGLEFSANYIAKNTEFYSDVSASCSGANCTSGIGIGTLANRPASCTTGVGYWATDQGAWNQSSDGLGNGQLYKCTATNAWSLYYTPYTYPHPLNVAEGGGLPAGSRLLAGPRLPLTQPRLPRN